MQSGIELWKQVIDDTALLERAAGCDPADVSAVTSLRKHYRAEAVAVALELTRARGKAIEKFGEKGGSLIADVAGIEQASSADVACYKARRICETLGSGTLTLDLCCGVGGDSMAMCDGPLKVVSVDRQPLRAWMAQRNTQGKSLAVCADVSDLVVDDVVLHIDPARRNEAAGRRAWRIDDYQPGPAVIGALIERASSAAIKLGPGVDLQSLPWPGEVGFISDRGRLVQCVLWTGLLQRDQRSATLIDGDRCDMISGNEASPPIDAMRRFIYTFDPAVERAGLIGRLCEQVDAPAIHPKLGLLSSDRVIDSPWLTGFELIDRLPWRVKRVRQWLKANDGGLVEVKTRGKACDPDREQQTLRGDGGTTYTVFVLRFDTKVEALITRRV